LKCLSLRLPLLLILLPAAVALTGCASAGPPAGTSSPDQARAPVADPAPRTADDTSAADAGGEPEHPQASQQQVVATVNGRAITLAQLQRPLIEAHGLNLLLNLVQLELVQQNAAEAGVTVTPEDLEQEYELTLRQMFGSTYAQHEEQVQALNLQREQALQQLARDAPPDGGSPDDATVDDARQTIEREFDQKLEEARADLRRDLEQFFGHFLTQERITRAEFDLVLQINAHLRKIAEPHVEARITDEAMQEAFRTLYGETVRIRHVQSANMQEVAEAKRRLAAGQPFEQVARELSRNPNTAIRGGELPVFSRATAGLPDAFKDTAFGLEVGEVSDPVQAEGAYHLIRLEERFEPRAVRFEDVEKSVRQTLYDQWMQVALRELRARLGQQAVQAMRIELPELRRQFEERMEQQQARNEVTGDE
jgi:parvulin-like peptidyl-prolyl isomerase